VSSARRPIRIDAAFEAVFDATAANCRLLTRAEARHFVDKGYVVVKGAFSTDIADAVRRRAWAELRDKHSVDRRDPSTWRQSFHGPRGLRGYARTAGDGTRFRLLGDAPRAFAAQADAVGGAARLPDDGAKLAWGTGAVANLGAGDGTAWQPAQARQSGWHKDGWHFRHFLDSPEQGLLAVPIYSDILPRSGGTQIATDSIAPVARLLAAHPEGLHADSVQGAGYLIPGLIEQCSAFEELIGEAGDLALVHPYMLHRACANPSPRPRFIANAALALKEPMRFERSAEDAYSLVELATLQALGAAATRFEATEPRRAYVPGPFRGNEEAAKQRDLLAREMRAMATAGVVTPGWGAQFGYQSNAA